VKTVFEPGDLVTHDGRQNYIVEDTLSSNRVKVRSSRTNGKLPHLTYEFYASELKLVKDCKDE